MKRRDFLFISSISAMGITLIPKFVSPAKNISTGAVPLVKNLHNRHGYFGQEFIVNKIKSLNDIEIKIDHFDNPEGDLIHVQIDTAKESHRFAFNRAEVLCERMTHIEKVDRNDLRKNPIWLAEEKMAIGSYTLLRSLQLPMKAVIPLHDDKESELQIHEINSNEQFDGSIICLAFY